MTAFTFFINGNVTFGDPNLHSNGPGGTQQWYHFMRGLVSVTGAPFPASVTGGSKFSLVPLTLDGLVGLMIETAYSRSFEVVP